MKLTSFFIATLLLISSGLIAQNTQFTDIKPREISKSVAIKKMSISYLLNFTLISSILCYRICKEISLTKNTFVLADSPIIELPVLFALHLILTIVTNFDNLHKKILSLCG